MRAGICALSLSLYPIHFGFFNFPTTCSWARCKYQGRKTWKRHINIKNLSGDCPGEGGSPDRVARGQMFMCCARRKGIWRNSLKVREKAEFAGSFQGVFRRCQGISGCFKCRQGIFETH